MNTTKILGEAVGIQSQGTVDKTETQTKEGLASALIVGRFKRGRIDKPMTIHQGNIRGQLGHEPTNIDYQAVQDCLDTGVPSVQVLRVGPKSNGLVISCAGATNAMSFSYISGVWDVYVDDMETPFSTGNIGTVIGALSLAYMNRINADYDGVMMLENKDTVPHRLKFVPVSNTSFTPNISDNPTFVEDGNGGFNFCLAPTSVVLGCEGSIDNIILGSINDGGVLRVYLNDVLVQSIKNFMFITNGIAEKLSTLGIEVQPLAINGQAATAGSNGTYPDSERAKFINRTQSFQKLRIEAVDATPVNTNYTQENQTFMFDATSATTTFCLAPSTQI